MTTEVAEMTTTTEVDKTLWYRIKEPTRGKYVSPDDANWLRRDDSEDETDKQLFCFVTGSEGLIAGKEIGPTGRPLVWTMQESALRPNVYYARLSPPPIDYNFRHTWFVMESDGGEYWIHEPTYKEVLGVGSNDYLIRWKKDDRTTQLYTLVPARKITPEEYKSIKLLVRPH